MSYKQAVKHWAKEESIPLEQYLYARNGMRGSKLISTISPYEIRAFGIERMKKGWLKDFGKVSYSVTLAKKAAVVGMNLRGQNSTVKNRLREAFFSKDYDEQMIYLIDNGSGLSKIGVSKSPVDRLKSLQTACGHQLILVRCWKIKDKATRLESELHKLFSLARREGEWFKSEFVSVDAVENAISHRCEWISA